MVIFYSYVKLPEGSMIITIECASVVVFYLRNISFCTFTITKITLITRYYYCHALLQVV